MGLIFLFRRLMFLQVILGILAFCMSEGNPGMMLLAGALGALSWYVVEGPNGKPLPQWLILLGAFIAVAGLFNELYRNRGNVILAMGHFTMWLQVLLLYARKSNRDYGMMMVLSLIQMIGAIVMTSTLFFAVLLVGYCCLALITLLLFQLKWTSDHVTKAHQAAAPADFKTTRPKAVVGKRHRLHFRLTAVMVGLSCAMVAALVYLSLPRSAAPKFDLHMSNPLAGKQAGFSDQIRLDGATINSVGTAPVLNMKVFMGDTPITGQDRSFLLRGTPLDRYEPFTYTWSRSSADEPDRRYAIPPEGLQLAPLPENRRLFRADFDLRVLTQNTLFTLMPVTSVKSSTIQNVSFNASDQGLGTVIGEAADSINAVSYSTFSPVVTPDHLFDQYKGRLRYADLPLLDSFEGRYFLNMSGNYASGWRNNVTEIREWALKILAAEGLERDYREAYTPQDRRIAQILSDYLRDHYKYSLDNPQLPSNVDPVQNFLLSLKQGHCELFASGLAAACRSLGMRARIVSGYMASDYNQVGGYYVVRQSDAHAWTEVFCGPEGWVTFDSTPPVDVAQEHSSARYNLGVLSDLFEYIEYTWSSNILSYNSQKRNAIITKTVSSVSDYSSDEDKWLNQLIVWIKKQFSQLKFDWFTISVISVIIFFVAVAIASLIHRHMVRLRRLTSLQLDKMPRKQRRKLVGRLRFYLQMLDMLDRHGHVRPAWQSPFEFAKDLANAHPNRFDPVVMLTVLFYEIRFGHRELDADRQKRIHEHLHELQKSLDKTPPSLRTAKA